MTEQKMYIEGRWCDAKSGDTYDAINPALGEPFARVPKGGREDAQAAIAAANKAFPSWRQTSLWDRVAFCQKIADLLDGHLDELADNLLEIGRASCRERV